MALYINTGDFINNNTITINDFLNPSNELAYLLGFIWADGNIRKYVINVEITKEDFIQIEPVLDKLGIKCKYFRNRPNRKPQASFGIFNVEISKLLISLDYDKKSFISADKIINYIPIELRPLWFRGYFDGDGCWYINTKNRSHQFSVCSSYEQDWKFCSDLFKSMNLNYSERRVILPNGNKYSQIRITNRNHIIKLGEYIYGDNIHLGLQRKYNKYQLVKFPVQ